MLGRRKLMKVLDIPNFKKVELKQFENKSLMSKLILLNIFEATLKHMKCQKQGWTNT